MKDKTGAYSPYLHAILLIVLLAFRLSAADADNDGHYEYWDDGYSSAAVCMTGGTLTIERTRFLRNASRRNGMGGGNSGALRLKDVEDCTVAECVFDGNQGYNAGGILSYGSNVHVDRCRFMNNAASSGAGAVLQPLYFGGNSQAGQPSMEFVNTLFRGNSCADGAADAAVQNGMGAEFYFCTFMSGSESVKNVAAYGDVQVTDCILASGIDVGSSAVLTVNSTCCPDDCSGYGTGNIRNPW